MGCSASRSNDFVTTDLQNPSKSWAYSSSSSFSHSQSSYSCSDTLSTPVSRTVSLPANLVHHPAMCKGDTNHLVSLTSSTYGSLVLIEPQLAKPNSKPKSTFRGRNFVNSTPHMVKSLNGSDIQDRSSPDSVINTWELMEGLDDDFDFHIVPSLIESPRKHKSNILELDTNELVNSFEFIEHSDSKPLGKHLCGESLVGNMDQNVASSYKKSLKCEESEDSPLKVVKSIESSNTSSLSSLLPNSGFHLKGTEDRIVLYYTSLRGIRKTYEDCSTVRMIFRGFRVCVDERDISMDSSYRNELRSVLEGKVVSLPQVFIGGRHIGGAEEIDQLHEAGELSKLLESFPVKRPGFVCENCGDARFVPCSNCNGSRKVFEDEEGEVRRCLNCNENGLIRCPGCCS